MSQLIEVKVPDIGGFDAVPVIELLVKPGDTVAAEDSLITLESDKATMDVPSPVAGVVRELRVAVGDKVSEGTLIAVLEVVESGESRVESAAPLAPAASPTRTEAPASAPPPAPAPLSTLHSPLSTQNADRPPAEAEPIQAPSRITMPTPAELAAEMVGGHKAHASPSVRAFARELGAEIGRVPGTGPKSRITRDDVVRYVKGIVSGSAAPQAGAPAAASTGSGLDLLPWPKVDFAKFGPVEAVPLSRIKKLSGANLARNWVMIPHVTQFDEADITELEALRVQINKENEKSEGAKLTMLAFLIKACVAGLKKFPEFNASLDGDALVMKRYFHIGFAADTPNGLVVPVIKNADTKSISEIAAETAALAKKARDGKLGPADMQGGCFSISSLGGIGGTAFTPIINAPEVAILGVSKTQTKPVWDGKAFQPRQMLPLSLSYDHRVIDGALAARFTAYLATLMADFRRVML